MITATPIPSFFTRANGLLLVLCSILSFSGISQITPTALINPVSNCEINYPGTVSVVLSNSGAVATSIDAYYTLNGATSIPFERQGVTALNGEDAVFNFATLIQSTGPNGQFIYGVNTLQVCSRANVALPGPYNCTTFNFTVYPQTVGGAITCPVSSVCSADPTLRTLTLSGHTGTVVNWEYSTDLGATWNTVLLPNPGPRHTQNTYDFSGLITTTYYRARIRSGYTNPAGTVQDGACSEEFSSIFIVTVHDYPAPPDVSDDFSVCSGNTINLAASSPVSGATYNWTTTAAVPFTSGLQNPSIPGSVVGNSGDYNCTVTANGCTGAAAGLTVTVNATPPAPTMQANFEVCTGDDVVLDATSAMGGTFSWLGPNSFNSLLEDPTIIDATIAASGSYSVTNTVSGCTGPAGTVVVTMRETPAASIASSNSAICDEATLNLVASTVTVPAPGVIAYNWTGPAAFGTSTTQNPNVPFATPAYSGTYTLYTTATYGALVCTSPTTSTDVIVNALPTIPAPGPTTNSPVCTGGTLQLTAPTVAGMTYNWNGPNGFASTLQNPAISNVTALAAGTYNIDITDVVTGCTSPKGTTAVVINPTPAAPTLTSPAVCAGTNLQLNANTVAGATYAWTGPDGFTSALEDPVVVAATDAAQGTYFATVTVAGCTGPAGSTSAVIKPIPDAPSLSTNSPICEGSNLQLNAANVTGGTFSWTGPAFGPVAGQNQTRAAATTAMSGTYDATVTVNGCTSLAASIDATVNAIPAAPVLSSNSPVCTGNTITLFSTTSAGCTYSWTGPNGFTSTLEDPVVPSAVALSAGAYNATVQNTATGCISLSGTTNVVINTTPAAPTLTSPAVCAGTNLQLNANTVASATYAWTGPDGFTSALEDPIVAAATDAAQGTYFATVTVSGCTSPAGSTSAVIKPIPDAPTLSSNSPICAGSNLQLNAANVTGGTFSWTGPAFGPIAGQNQTRAAATTAMSGTYNATVTVNACTSLASSISATVNAIPATPAPTSNSAVCEGATLNLSTAAVAGATYSWTGPSSFTSTARTPSIAVIPLTAAGAYNVTTTVSGCTSLAGTTNVTITAKPATPLPTSNSAVCSGSTLNLSVNAVGGATYSWTGPNAYTNNVTNTPSIAGVTSVNAGIYSVVIRVSGCDSDPGSTSVTVDQTPATPVITFTNPVCEGGTLQLNSSLIPGATYNWSGPLGFASTAQNPAISPVLAGHTGVYSVVASIGSCTSSASTPINITARPATPAVSSNSPICEGSTLSLSSPLIAGLTYSWTSTNGFTSASDSPSIPAATTSHSGVYTLIVTNGAGCPSAPSSLTAAVNSVPNAPIPGSNSAICEGATLNLYANTITNATAYTWTGPAFGVPATGQNQSVAGATAAASGTYSVTVTVNGCTSAAGTTDVSVIATPAAPVVTSAPATICEGGTVSLSATSIPGATYNWTGPNAFTANTRNPVINNVTTANTGVYSVIATIGSCSSVAGTGNVTVTALPATPTPFSNTPVCEGNPINLSTAAVGGATYAWTGPNGYTSAAQNPTINPAATTDGGIYTVRVTAGGCQSAPGSTSVSVNTVPAAPNVPLILGPVCEGTDINLVVNPPVVIGGTYNWSGPGGYTSSLQNPTIPNASAADAGGYSVVVTQNGCTSPSSTTTVLISPSPAAPTLTSDSPACVGETLILSSTIVAGATSYDWSGPAGFNASTLLPSTSFVTTSANESGIYSVTVTVAGCPSPAATTQVDVYAIPPAPVITSNSPVCEGAILNLFASQIQGASYTWTGPAFGVPATVQNPSINSVQLTDAGTYDVFATVSGCVGPTASAAITVNDSPDAPNAGSNSPLCAGDDLNLTASTPLAGVTYDWTGPNSFSSTTQNPTITGVGAINAGSYFVTATLGSCTGPAGIAPVTVSTAPTAMTATYDNVAGVLCEGTTLQLHANNVTGAVYNWTGPAGYTSNEQHPTISNVQASQAGLYTVTATVGGGCSGTPGSVNVVLTSAPAAPVAVTSNSPVCEGGPLNFTASAVAGVTFDWTGPNSFTSTVQNPSLTATMAASGTYTIRTFDGTCYSSPTTLAVVINATPNAPVATSNSPVCEGSAINLSASSIPGATYSWSGPSGAVPGGQNTSVAGSTTAMNGIYSVTATLGGCTSLPGTTNVVVTAAPAPTTVSANGPLCEGIDLQLDASTVVGAVYNWSGPNGFASIEQNPTIPDITTAGEGTYTLITTVAGACSSSTASVFVDVIPAPVAPASASSNSPICTAAAINLTSSTVAGMTYSWTGPNGFTSSVQSPTIASATINHSGTYSVRTNDGTCFSAQSANVDVLVNPTPDAPFAGNDGPSCSGSNVQLTASSIPGASYAWSGPAGYTASTQNPVISGAGTGQSGTYSVTASVNGCVGPAGTTDLVVNPATVPGSVSGSATVCSGSNGGPLTLSGHSGTILHWVTSTDGGATWVNIANTTATQNYSNLTQTTIYAAALQNGSCPEMISGTATITVIPEAIGGVISNNYPGSELCLGDNNGVLTLTGYAGNIVQWEVTTDGGITWDTIANTTDTLSYTNLIKNTTYRVLLQGCTSYDYSETEVLVVTFEACNDDIVIATMVTPNNDHHNDTWLIEDLASYPAMEVTILNRYGTQIFHSDHYMNEWDATYNGDPLPDGTYYYVIKMSGSDTILKGHINILK